MYLLLTDCLISLGQIKIKMSPNNGPGRQKPDLDRLSLSLLCYYAFILLLIVACFSVKKIQIPARRYLILIA